MNFHHPSPWKHDHHVRTEEDDLENASVRTEILRELRSERLIGKSAPLFDWQSAYRTPADLLNSSRDARDYYEDMNQQIEHLVEVDELLDSGINVSLLEEYGDDIGVEEPRQRRPIPTTIHNASQRGRTSVSTVKFWINANLAANVVLLLGKLVVFYMTDSLSIVASLIDSVLDLLSTVIIFISSRVADQRDWKTKHLYPVGRSRLEPIGVLVFSVVMVVSFLKVADESVERLLGDKGALVEITFPSFLIMVVTVLVKVVLYYLCRNVQSSAVQALALDAVTDVMFNTFSIIFPLAGHLFHSWRMDPLGALFLSVYVVKSWGGTAMEHIDNLSGAAASPEDRQQLLYLCMRFSSNIRYITAFNAYHAGDKLMVEVDLLLDKELNLRDSHDLAESVQYAMETMPTVERAFVHLDYRRENFTGHVER
ncbi:Metal tolerance protein 4 [Wickerhamiella sorbophila]|uniref:Metal tolerance protein 4 n=1 Tax=Wickerhamiella sorbophila TaxID=45607 RepID=A0A2T0FE50_9ASCO|nr:Metal tolerance protein 4 [Wickerhamiella sorbophila]PRT53261.1 Metal tolerance protein 4 [Wickerhamiella sorbophila]